MTTGTPEPTKAPPESMEGGSLAIPGDADYVDRGVAEAPVPKKPKKE